MGEVGRAREGVFVSYGRASCSHYLLHLKARPSAWHRKWGTRLGQVRLQMDILFAVLPFTDVEHPAIAQVVAGAAQACGLLLRNLLLQSGSGGADRSGALWLACPLRGPTHARHVCAGCVNDRRVVFRRPRLQWPDSTRAPSTSQSFAPCTGRQELIPQILEARRCRREFIDQCVFDIRVDSPRVVGFTTSFHQTCACLAVAVRLKEMANPPMIILGGANCGRGVMGLQMIRSFPWLDYVCTGEGDAVLPWFLQRVPPWRPASGPRDLATGRKTHSKPPSPREGNGCAPLPRLLRLLPKTVRFFPCWPHQPALADRNFTRLLVGEKQQLHILRSKWGDDGIPEQIAESSDPGTVLSLRDL